MRIVVDADACPVKSEIVEVANEFNIPVRMVASFDHRLAPVEGVEMVQVDRSSESADLYIANHIKAGDLVITQDFGLACLVLAKHALVLSFRGEQYTEGNIDYLLERRAESAKRRRQGLKTKGPKALFQANRKVFQQKMTKVLLNQQENHEI